jgi:hypothetical protein
VKSIRKIYRRILYRVIALNYYMDEAAINLVNTISKGLSVVASTKIYYSLKSFFIFIQATNAS